MGSEQVAVSHKPRVAQEMKKLKAEGEQKIAEAKAKLQLHQQAADEAEARITAQMQHLAEAEAGFEEFQDQQLAEVARLRQSTVEMCVTRVRQQPQRRRQACELEELQKIVAEFHRKILEYEESQQLKKSD